MNCKSMINSMNYIIAVHAFNILTNIILSFIIDWKMKCLKIVQKI